MSIKRCMVMALLAISTFANIQAQDTSSLLPAGSEAPAFSIPSIDGKNVSLKDFRGQYLVIDFWASWCPDCRKENPGMVKLYKEFHPKGVAFLSVSFDDKAERWKAAIEKDSLTWTHVSELKKWKETTISGLYGIKWIPTVYVIDPQGKVVFSALESKDVADVLRKALK